MKLSQLANKANLRLAWRRITTGANYQYKQYYRHLYYAYEVALEANLSDLRVRLLGGAFEPQHPSRIYLTKASGLHRPLTLLNIEDQIVLQAFANLAASRMHTKRLGLQFHTVFSNILETNDSIFFFRRWQSTYNAFQKQIHYNYSTGMRWVGDFDLAAFYDTISHELLLRTIYPRTTNNDLEWMERCLQTWSSDQAMSGHGHGLPQGPLASDFLAECFLLPIDLALQGRRGYMRYVDDVRLFGSTEDEVRADLIELERLCRERGLIPQAGKFAIKLVQSVHEALAMLPSLSDPQHDDSSSEMMDGGQAYSVVKSAVSGRPYQVVDKTRLRYTLFRAQPNSALLKLVMRLIPRNPEHADVFFVYIGRFQYRRPIELLCHELVKRSPYSFIRGESWHVLARYRRLPKSGAETTSKVLNDRAVRIVRGKRRENFAERWGACDFLCAAADMTSRNYERWLKFQDPLLQAFVAPALPGRAFAQSDVVRSFLLRTTPEPGLSVAAALHQHGLTPASFGLQVDQIPSQVANSLRELGVIQLRSSSIDPIAEILASRYRTPKTKSWRTLLGSEYVHALGLLKQAEATFLTGRSFWLVCQNSFNQTIFLALQKHLQLANHPSACTTTNKNGQLVDFGVTLESKERFSSHHPAIGRTFREINARRNSVPVAHPYAKSSKLQTLPLGSQERNRLISLLATAYCDFILIMPPY